MPKGGYGDIAKQVPFGTIALILGGFLLVFFISTGDWPWKQSRCQ